MNFLQGLSVLVLGLGDSGLAMARWCVRSGAAAVRVWDSREAPPQAAALAALGVPCRGGVLQPDALDGVQLVLKSPGLAPHDGRIAPLLAAARERAIATGGELTLFARALADLRAECGYAPHVLAITGTNGKTTTTALTALLVERAGQRVAVAGNIGPTMLDTLAAALDAAAGDGGEPLPEAWVLELSSFQLEDGRGFEPSAAVVLNVTQDHLDWHGTMPAYAAAKARIYGQDAVMVIPRDDPLVAAMVPPPPVAPKKGPRPPARRVVSFGLDAPRRAGDFGLSDEGGMCWLVRAVAADEGEAKPRRGDPAAAAEPAVQLQRLMPMDALRLRGRHNAANALAALALATAIGCPLAPMLHGLREYRGEPHRVEPVGLVDGVEAFDDSKGTNVGATVAALESLGLDKHPGKLVVILGGDGKGQDFAPLAAPLARHARAVALIGKDAEAIAAAIAPAGVAASRHADLGAATRWCFTQARGGDAVLLSPACASLDMFRNYAHRAEVFLAEVRAIGAERGEVQ